MAGYIGTTPVPQATQHRESFTATGGQTSFATAGYTPQFIDVYLNGVKLAPADYTATNGSDVVLASGATASDILEIVAYTPFEVANQTFTGDTSVTNLAVTGTFTSRGIDDNADAVAITIDSSENVGIGTSSPNSALDVAGEITLKGTSSSFASVAQPRLYRSGSSSGSYPFNDFGHLIIQPRGDGANRDIIFATGTAGANKTVIDSSGRVGIGTSSPSDDVEISTSADGKGLTIKNAGNNRPYLNFDSNRSSAGNNLAELHFKWNGTDVARIIAVAGSDTTNKDDGHITFSTSSTGSVDERMRLDSSGNLLVGKTSADFGSSIGFEANSNDTVYATRSGGASLTLNRTTSDGDIALFRKDNATVGSIGTTGGDLYIATGDTGIRFDDSADQIRASTSAGSNRDGAIDIGFTDSRFKDLYLSGGVYLGGTGAANKLDDYEEGTWTPAVSNMTVTGTLTTAGRYTKVGRMVSLMGWVSATTSIAHGVSALISGFPFAGASVTGELQSRSAGVIVAGANADLPSSNHSAACFVDSPNSRAFLGNFTTTAANEYIYINVVYYTA